MMDAKEYRRHLRRLGLPVSGKRTCELLHIDPRTSRAYATLSGQPYPVPRGIELALRLMVKHGESPEAWLAARPAKRQSPTR